MKGKVNEINIIYRKRHLLKDSSTVKCSKDSADILISKWNQETITVQETFKVLLLNNAHKVKGIFEVSNGGITGTLVDCRILFAVALKSLSTAIIIAHNHPSGVLRPSEQDKILTRKIKEGSQILDIKLLDHIIISPYGDYFSFADEGIL